MDELVHSLCQPTLFLCVEFVRDKAFAKVFVRKFADFPDFAVLAIFFAIEVDLLHCALLFVVDVDC